MNANKKWNNKFTQLEPDSYFFLCGNAPFRLNCCTLRSILIKQGPTLSLSRSLVFRFRLFYFLSVYIVSLLPFSHSLESYYRRKKENNLGRFWFQGPRNPVVYGYIVGFPRRGPNDCCSSELTNNRVSNSCSSSVCPYTLRLFVYAVYVWVCAVDRKVESGIL